MLSTTHHVTAHSVSPQGMRPGVAGTPETGGFDFFAYLLGLQDSNLAELKGAIDPNVLGGIKP